MVATMEGTGLVFALRWAVPTLHSTTPKLIPEGDSGLNGDLPHH